jgi:hypothetical protein
METLRKFVYRLSILMAVVAFITSRLNGITLLTSFIRSAIVFVGTIVLVILALNAVRWGMMLNRQEPESTESTHVEPKKQN